MIDHEKVLKGLKCCINADGKPLDRNCTECPYAVINGTCISVIPLMEDALQLLKEYESALWTMGELNDIQTEKLVKAESQFRAMCDLSNKHMETLHEREHTISELENAAKSLELIADIAFDYDGANTVEGLKSIIDEIREIAIKGVQNADHRNLDTQCT